MPQHCETCVYWSQLGDSPLGYCNRPGHMGRGGPAQSDHVCDRWSPILPYGTCSVCNHFILNPSDQPEPACRLNRVLGPFGECDDFSRDEKVPDTFAPGVLEA